MRKKIKETRVWRILVLVAALFYGAMAVQIAHGNLGAAYGLGWLASMWLILAVAIAWHETSSKAPNGKKKRSDLRLVD